MTDLVKLRSSSRVRRVDHATVTVQGYPSSRYTVTLREGWVFASGSQAGEFRYTRDALAAVQAATPVIPS